MQTQTLERNWIPSISTKFPRKWIVVVNIGNAEVRNTIVINGTVRSLMESRGTVYAVCDTEREALAVKDDLDDSYGRTEILEGYDDRPMIGCIYV